MTYYRASDIINSEVLYMSMETDVLLRTVLFQIKTNDKEKAIIAIEAMCPKDLVAAVNEKVAEYKSKQQ